MWFKMASDSSFESAYSSSFHKAIEFSLRKLGKPKLELKTEQYDAIRAICFEREDALTVLPPGFDKSLSYQILPGILTTFKAAVSLNVIILLCLLCHPYRNFRTFTRTADYSQRSIFVVRRKNIQPITRTPKPKKIMLLYYGDKNSQTWSDEYSMGLNPVEAPKTFFALNCDCLNRKHNCDDHTFISFHVSVYKAEDRSHFLLRINR